MSAPVSESSAPATNAASNHYEAAASSSLISPVTSESYATLLGAWHSYGKNYVEITFVADGTYSWRSIVMGVPAGSASGDNEKGFMAILGESEPHSSYQPPEHYPAFGTWHVMTDEEWAAWVKRKKQTKVYKRRPRLCIYVAECHIRLRRFDPEGRTIGVGFPPKGVEVFVLSRQGTEMYCVEGGTTYLFRKGALADLLPKVPPADSFKANDTI